ncbi:MAG: hypothetical protein KDC95_06535 [Planctomycetes bacterium]|nr:hypothetical protein [Planctomycetota bacterium]
MISFFARLFGKKRPNRAREGSPEFEAILTQAMQDNGIHEAFRETVRRLVFEDGDGWRRCCGSGCDPCVEQFARAVDAIRRQTAGRV